MRSHIPAWAIAYAENGLISSDELVETVGRAKGFRGLYERLFRPARRARLNHHRRRLGVFQSTLSPAIEAIR